jgi:hypothetical protein
MHVPRSGQAPWRRPLRYAAVMRGEATTLLATESGRLLARRWSVSLQRRNQLMNITRAAWIAVAALGTAVGFAAACTDATEPPANTAPHSQATAPATPAPGIAETGTRSRTDRPGTSAAAEFHRANRMDWVGVAHNRGLDVFRAELRAHKYRSLSQLCEGVLEMTLREGLRSPEHQQASAGERRSILQGVLPGMPGCNEARTSFAPATTPPGPSAVRFASYVPASASASLVPVVSVQSSLDQITYAVSVATDVNSLAIRLGEISSAARVLDAAGQQAVLGAASLALSSVEYWQANYSAFEAEVIAEYGCGSLNCEEPYSVLGSSARRQFAQGAWRAARTIGGYDISAGFATILKTWLAGPIGWEAAADAAVVGSAVGAVHYILESIKPT